MYSLYDWLLHVFIRAKRSEAMHANSVNIESDVKEVIQEVV